MQLQYASCQHLCKCEIVLIADNENIQITTVD